MLVPLEIAVGLVVVAIALVWSAMRSEPSALRRATSVSAAIGAIMIAIAGRFPPLPGDRGFSPFVMAGVVVVVTSIVVSALATLIGLVRKKRPDGRPSGGVG
jgi:multisubunit Na+/H+ antiporter MnhB subunit